jgi:NADH:ubiquinone oxidoreductase subunit C
MKYTDYQQIALRLNENMLKQIERNVPGLVYSVQALPDNLLIRTCSSKIRPLAFYLRNSTHLQFRTLVDIAVVDKLLPQGRFAVNYLFLSTTLNQRITVQVFANETSTLPSLAVPFGNRRLFASAL